MEYPHMKLQPIQQPNIDFRYKQFMGDSGEMKTIPSSHELALIQQELRRTSESNSQTAATLMENQEQIQKWIQRHDPEGIVDKQRKVKTKVKEQDAESPDTVEEPGDIEGRRSKRSSIGDSERVIASVDGEGGVRVSLSDQGNIKILNPKPRSSSGKNLSHLQSAFDSPKNPFVRKDKEKKRRADSVSVRSTPDPEQSGPAVGDYSKVKVQQNQIPIVTFWGFMDQYLRNLTTEDMQGLESNVIE
jgi:hypothetical protein